MNIFVLDEKIANCAQYLCDKHVVKMVLETTQLLCTAHQVLDGTNPDLYKKTHENHPCSIWVRENSHNYVWAANLYLELCQEYSYRYGKIHKCQGLINSLSTLPKNIPYGTKLGNFVLAMPDEFKTSSPIQSYRNYYISKQTTIKMEWNKGRAKPSWITDITKGV